MIKTAPILFYIGDLSTLYDTVSSAGVAFTYVDAALDVLTRFERVIIASPATDDEIDRVYNILSALKRHSPAIKVYGYTEKRSDEALSIWATKEQAWKTQFDTLIDGIYIANFDATDAGPATVSQGAWTRADQNLAITGCHNDGYSVWAESLYPELSLGPAGVGDVASTLGADESFEDCIVLLPYTSNVSTEDRTAGGRAALAKYVVNYSNKTGINLYTAVFHHDLYGTVIDYIPINDWLTLQNEAESYGVDGFGAWTSLLGDPSDRRWFLTNQNRSYSFLPTSTDTSVTYARVYGRVLNTESGLVTGPLTLKYRRAAGLLSVHPYLDNRGEITITPDAAGNWETLVAAAASPGTVYTLTLYNDWCVGPVRKRDVTLIGGTSYEF